MRSTRCYFVGCEIFRLGVKDDGYVLYPLQHPVYFSVMYWLHRIQKKTDWYLSVGTNWRSFATHPAISNKLK